MVLGTGASLSHKSVSTYHAEYTVGRGVEYDMLHCKYHSRSMAYKRLTACHIQSSPLKNQNRKSLKKAHQFITTCLDEWDCSISSNGLYQDHFEKLEPLVQHEFGVSAFDAHTQMQMADDSTRLTRHPSCVNASNKCTDSSRICSCTTTTLSLSLICSGI